MIKNQIRRIDLLIDDSVACLANLNQLRINYTHFQAVWLNLDFIEQCADHLFLIKTKLIPKSFYEYIGVEKNSSLAEIEEQFRLLIEQNNTVSVVQTYREMYAVLSDTEGRK